MNCYGQKPVMKVTFINSLLKHFMVVWDPLVFCFLFFKPPLCWQRRLNSHMVQLESDGALLSWVSK